MSSGVYPGKDNEHLVPAMGLKFLRDGIHSADLVSMYSIDGNPKGDKNFFSQDFKNHLAAGTTTPTILLAKKFATATNYITSIGLSDFAAYDAQGNKESDPVFPFSIRWAPNKDIANNTNDYFIK